MADDAALPRSTRRQGDAATGRDRLPRILLPLPRHADGRALRERRALDDRHGAPDRGRARRARATSTATTRSRPGSAPTPTLSTDASSGTGRRRARPRISMGWTPEEGFHAWDWHGYDEAMIVYLLALGSPTHPIDPDGLGRVDEHLQVGHVPGAGAPQLLAALRAPVLATSGSTSAASRTPTCAARASTTSRTRGARRSRSARTRSPTRAASPATAPDVWGLTACDGPLDATLDGRRPLAQVPDLRGARRLARRRARRRHDRADRGGGLDRRSRRRSSCRRCARWRGAGASDVWNQLRLPRRLQPDAGATRRSRRARAHRAGRRAGSTRTSSASTRGRSSP